MQSGWGRPVEQRCFKQGRAVNVLGLALIASGLILLFLCIPGWAWAALAGVLLILLGFALIRLGKSGR